MTGISVVIPSYRRAAALGECLRSLAEQSTTPRELVVVLRAGDIESAAVARDCAAANVVVAFVDRPGVLAALETGVRASSGEIVAFIDDDAVAPPDWLTRLADGMRDGVGAIGGRDRIPRQETPRTFDVGRITHWGKVVFNHHLGTGGLRDVDVLKGVNMAIRRTALAIPEGLIGQGAQSHFEIAMSLHVRAAGLRVLYDPTIVVDHRPAARHDSDARLRPDPGALRAGAYNLVLSLLSFRGELRTRRAAYGLLVGDRGAPGLARAAMAALTRDADVIRSLVPSLRGQASALRAIHRGRGVRMRPATADGEDRAAATPQADGRSRTAGWRRLSGIGRELQEATRETADARSRARLIADVALYRALRVWPGLATAARRREIRMRGAQLTYRLNRGDIQGIREVWLERNYRLPPPHAFRTIVDLGTNIGLTSVWLQAEYGADYVLGVEPDRDNVVVARKNFRANGVVGRIIEAAVGPTDGEVTFARAEGASNLGHVAATGDPVRQVSMATVLAALPPGRRIDLLKLDIEGGEAALLLADDLEWLRHVDAIIVEFHPELVDIQRLTAVLTHDGFTYFPAGSVSERSMDIFRRHVDA